MTTGLETDFGATAGAVLAGQDPEPLAEYARNLGLAFQIQDDVLDVTGDEAETGKRTNEDTVMNRYALALRGERVLVVVAVAPRSEAPDAT